MSADPVSTLGELLAGMAERVAQYGEMAKDAAAKNAKGEYTSDAVLADFSTVFKQVVKDTVEVSAAMVKALTK